jgi:ribosomal protein S18 acetylase RimI-like enzyme
VAARKKASDSGDAPPANDDALKRERAGTYRTRDGRFTVEQSSSGWLLLDGEQTNELGLPLTRGSFATLDAAREAVSSARSGPAPTSDIRARPVARRPAIVGPPARPSSAGKGAKAANVPRRAPKRSDPAALVIRELRTVDGNELRRLWTDAGFRSLGDDDRSLARLVRRNPGLVLVATEAGRIVGSALGAWDGRRGAIYHVTTAKSRRRRGIATRLVTQVEAGLRDLGCAEVRVNVGDDNEDAGSFWEARGYESRRSRPFARNIEAG